MPVVAFDQTWGFRVRNWSSADQIPHQSHKARSMKLVFPSVVLSRIYAESTKPQEELNAVT